MLTASRSAPVCAAVRRGFGPLPCPGCFEVGTLVLDITETTGTEAFKCQECDHTFGISNIAAIVKAWSEVVAWVGTAPVIE